MKDRFENFSARAAIGQSLSGDIAAVSVAAPLANSLRYVPGTSALTTTDVQNISLLTELKGSFFARVSTNMPLLTELRPKANVSAASIALTIATFFLNRSRRRKTPGEGTRPTCFAGWKSDKVFYYVLVNLLNGNVFVAPDRFGRIGLTAIAWLDDAARIQDLDARGLPLFDWNEFLKSGDSIVIADVAGDRKLMPEILEQATGRWADAPQKRLFTYRQGTLVELSWKTVLRFSGINGGLPCG